jgi:hypothetical protein
MPSRLFYTGPSLPTLHEEYAKHSRIDEAAQLTSESSVLIEAPLPPVWALLSDVAQWPSWYPQMTVLSIGAVRPDAPLHWKRGRVAIRSTFAVVDPPHELTWTGRFFGYNAVGQHLLEPAGDNRTKVTIRESLTGPLLPVLYRESTLQAGHQQWLAALKAAAEHNALPHPASAANVDANRRDNSGN